jgi:hypothetical protein
MDRFLSMALILVALAACAERPPPATKSAMVAATPQSAFGYSETKLAPDRYEVSYVTPALSLPADSKARASALEKEGRRAYDLALWRAAQLALAGGFTQLSIGPSHRDEDVKVTTRYQPTAPGVYGPGGMIYPQWIYNPLINYYGLPGIGPYWAYDDPFAEGPDISVHGRITARLEARFAREPSPGSLDAKATEKRLASEYGASAY